MHSQLRMTAFTLCLLGVAHADGVAPPKPVPDAKVVEGLWSGSWGGGARGGVVFQPVTAEMVIDGNRVEMLGFRNVKQLTGLVRFDARANRMKITSQADDRSKPRTIEYTYQLKGDKLTLTDADNVATTLTRHRVVRNPLANVDVELVTATGINEAGDLLVTEFSGLRTERTGDTYFQPQERALETDGAAIFRIEPSGLKAVTLDQARAALVKPTPVVVTYRRDDRRSPKSLHKLWRATGAPAPDSKVVWQTYARLLRPGSLIFVLSTRANAVRP